MRLKAQLKVLLVSTALFFSIVTQAATGEVSSVAYGFFGAVTLALAYRWVLVDADNAFKAAVSKRQVLLAGAPAHVTHIDSTCPRRWFVLLHIHCARS
jgi:hypothetical protein